MLIFGNEDAQDLDCRALLKEHECDSIQLFNASEFGVSCLKYADALCLSSTYEGLPLVLLEALSMKVTAICTPVGGIPDVVAHKKTGFISDDVSKDSYVSAIDEFLTSDELTLNQIKKKGRLLYEAKYSIEKCALKYLDVYTSVRSDLL